MTQNFENLLRLAVGYADLLTKGVDDVPAWDEDAKSFVRKDAREEPEEPVEDSPADEAEDLAEGEDEDEAEDEAEDETEDEDEMMMGEASPESYNANLVLVQEALPEGLYAIPENPMQEAAWNAAMMAAPDGDIRDAARRTAAATNALWEGGEAYVASSEWPSGDPADPQEVDPSVVNAFDGVEGFTADEIAPYWREAWEAERATMELGGNYDQSPSVSAVAARVVDALKAIYAPAP